MKIYFVLFLFAITLSCSNLLYRTPNTVSDFDKQIAEEKSNENVTYDNIEEVVFRLDSKMVKDSITTLIYLPKQRTETNTLPVVYFLHGRGDSINMFSRIGGKKALSDYLKSGGLPFAVVNLQGKNAERNFYWVDEVGRKNEKGQIVETGLPWATMLMTELLPLIEEKYNFGKSINNRLIAGISMGSAGSLQIAMNFQGLFKCVAGHSLVVRDPKSAVEQFPIAFGSEADYRGKSPLYLLRKFNENHQKPFSHVWVDIGGSDNAAFIDWAKGVSFELNKMGFSESRGDYIDVATKFPTGGHDDAYWNSRINEYVQWYGKCFNWQ